MRWPRASRQDPRSTHWEIDEGHLGLTAVDLGLAYGDRQVINRSVWAAGFGECDEGRPFNWQS